MKSKLIRYLNAISIAICLMGIMVLFDSCDRLKGITTIYGTVTAPGVGPVDSVIVEIYAWRGFLPTTISLTQVITNEKGEYSATVDPPRGYGHIGCYVPTNDNAEFTSSYRAAIPYENGKKVGADNIPAGTKHKIDFELIK